MLTENQFNASQCARLGARGQPVKVVVWGPDRCEVKYLGINRLHGLVTVATVALHSTQENRPSPLRFSTSPLKRVQKRLYLKHVQFNYRNEIRYGRVDNVFDANTGNRILCLQIDPDGDGVYEHKHFVMDFDSGTPNPRMTAFDIVDE